MYESDMRFANFEFGQTFLADDVVTLARWTSGGPVSLPVVDQVVLVRGGRALGTVPFERLLAEMPHLFEADGGYPPRYVAYEFPEDWQLGALALDPPPGRGPPGPGEGLGR
jgi:hypothetical protein